MVLMLVNLIQFEMKFDSSLIEIDDSQFQIEYSSSECEKVVGTPTYSSSQLSVTLENQSNVGCIGGSVRNVKSEMFSIILVYFH